jgi:hypothetical protein
MMNGDDLLTTFIDWIKTNRPERFYPLKWAYDESEENEWKKSKYVPNLAWGLEVAKECCYGAYDAILTRTLDGVAHEVIPLEVKADTDTLDDRLRAQFWVHILNYGKSMLLLGKEQAFKIKKLHLDKILPTEIWTFNGEGFTQVTEPINKFHGKGSSEVSKRALEKAFGISDSKQLRHLQIKVHQVRAIITALEFNQYSFGEERKFTQREAEIAEKIFDMELHPAVCEPPKEKDLSSVKNTGFSHKDLQEAVLTKPGKQLEIIASFGGKET